MKGLDLGTVIAACAAALTAVVGVLWKILWSRVKDSEVRQDKARQEAEARHREDQAAADRRAKEAQERHEAAQAMTQLALDKCREEHEEQGRALLNLTASVGRLEGRREGIEAVTAEVLARIDTLRRGDR